MAGVGLFLAAVGAVLYWGVNADLSGVDLDVIGVILMVVGAIGFVFGMSQGRFAKTRTERHVSADGQHVVEENRSTGM